MAEKGKSKGLKGENSLNPLDNTTMSSAEKEGKRVSRREFVKGTAVGAAGVAAAGVLAGCAPAATPTAAPAATPVPCPTCEPCPTAGLPEKWDYEADVVILGFGAAGGAAAVEAAGAGAEVLILEKMPEATAGGASSCFGGIFFIPSATNMFESSMGTMTIETATAIADEAHNQYNWALEKGNKMREDYPFLVQGGSKAWYATFKKAVTETAGVSIMYSTPAKALVQVPETKEIRGVLAEQDGKAIYVKAKKAVIIATGSYNANTRLIAQLHYPGLKVTTVDSPANTGDGLLMGMAAGAALDNMGKSFDWFEFAFRVPSEKYGTGISHRQWHVADFMLGRDSAVLYESRIFVNMKGQRFMNEKEVLTHKKSYPLPFLTFATPGGWVNIPAFLVCDDKCIKSGPLGSVPSDDEWEWAKSQNIYHWSPDNSAEIEAGWVIKADTLEELAAKMTAKGYLSEEVLGPVDAAALKATVDQYNTVCTSGNDPLGRPPETLKPIVTPPFYAAELMPCGVYNTGGLRYSENAQTLDYNDNPIPRLYSAGNVGQGLALGPYGVAGCMACGALAARHAVTLNAWK